MPSRKRKNEAPVGKVPAGQARILVVDDEPDFLKITSLRLESAGYEVTTSGDYAGAFRSIRDKAPDLILLDVMMPGADGFEVKERLNLESSTAKIPVIFLTAKDMAPDKIRAYKLGTDDYITKPYDPEELITRIEAVLKRKRHYEEISMTDALTGLRNTNYFKMQMKTFFAIAKRYGQIFSLAIVDIDNLKKINDTHGHIAGDSALKGFAQTARKVLREADIITRYGGDEFAIILPGVGRDAATKAIERLKADIALKRFPCEALGVDISCSISAGVAEYGRQMKDENALFAAADAKMYADKEGKRR